MGVRVQEHTYKTSSRLVKGCRQILKANKVEENTKVTILTCTSYPEQHVVNSYYQAALDLGAEATIIMNEEYKVPATYGQGSIRVPKATEAALWASDLVIFMGIDIFYTPLEDKIRAEKKPTFWGYNTSSTTELLIINYPPPCEAVVKRTDAGVELLTKGSEVRYVTPAGTDLTMGIRGMKGSREVGFLEPDKGHIFDLLGGAGMYCFFEPESCNGTYVIAPGDYPSEIVHRNGFPYTGDKITFTIKDGKITKIEGGIGAKLMREWLESWNSENSYILAHMGIGTDPRMRKDFDKYLSYLVGGADGEWIEGFINLGVGIGGPSHTDFMQRHGSVWIDGEKILDDEKFVGPLSDEALGIKK